MSRNKYIMPNELWPTALSSYLSSDDEDDDDESDVEDYSVSKRSKVAHLFLLSQFVCDPFLLRVEVAQVALDVATLISIVRQQDHDPTQWSRKRETTINDEKWSNGVWLVDAGDAGYSGSRYMIVGHEEYGEEVSLKIEYTDVCR